MKRLAIGILVVLVAAIAHAQEVWVDAANGSDTAGVGTLAQPWRTLSFALTQPVTTLHVLPGTYDSALGEHFPIPFLSGVTIVGSGAATTIVRGGPSVAVFQGTFLGRHVPGAARLFGLTLARELGTAAPGVDFTSYLGSSVDVEIGSCVIEGHQDGVRGIAVGREVRIHDCFVRGNGRDGIRIAFTGCLSARTFIERNVVEANSGRGIELESYCEREPADPNFPTTSLNVTVRKNVVRQNDKGIFVLAGLLRTFEGYLSDGEVVGSIDANWIADNVDAGIVLRTEASGRLTTSATNNVLAGNAVGIRTTVSFPNPAILPQLSPLVVNDTIVGNTVAGYAEDSSPRAMSSIVNSIVAGNGDDLLGLTFDQVRFSDIGDGEFAGSIGNISADPEFVDGTARDFHLRATSPCIEIGSPQAATNASAWLDFDGQARNVDADQDGIRNVDMGAFEFAVDGIGWRYGNTGAAIGFPENVVFVNGSAGDPDRVVHLPAGAPAQLGIVAPSHGPLVAPFALFAYVGVADAPNASRQPGGLGTAAIPTPLNGPNPRVIVAFDNLPTAARTVIGDGRFPSSPAPTSATIPARLLQAGLRITLQGFITDSRSRQGAYAITNAVVVRVP